MFLLVPAYPGCPGSKAVKRSSLLYLRKHFYHHTEYITTSASGGSAPCTPTGGTAANPHFAPTTISWICHWQHATSLIRVLHLHFNTLAKVVTGFCGLHAGFQCFVPNHLVPWWDLFQLSSEIHTSLCPPPKKSSLRWRLAYKLVPPRYKLNS